MPVPRYPIGFRAITRMASNKLMGIPVEFAWRMTTGRIPSIL